MLVEPIGFADLSFGAIAVYCVLKASFGNAYQDLDLCAFSLVRDGMYQYTKRKSDQRAAFGRKEGVDVALATEMLGFGKGIAEGCHREVLWGKTHISHQPFRPLREAVSVDG